MAAYLLIEDTVERREKLIEIYGYPRKRLISTHDFILLFVKMTYMNLKKSQL